MVLLDWLTTLAKEPVSDFTLGALADWLEEKGDKRGEVIRKASVWTYGYNCVWRIVFSESTIGNYPAHDEDQARKYLSIEIINYLLSTDPIT